MVNSWITHVKQFAAKHHLKYGDALKRPQCRVSYHNGAIRGTGPKPQPSHSREYTCAVCEQRKPVNDDARLYPRKCYNENINPHQICPECWFDETRGFALESANHKCPGCMKGMPFVYTGSSKQENRKRNLTTTPPQENIVFELLSDSDSDSDGQQHKKRK